MGVKDKHQLTLLQKLYDTDMTNINTLMIPSQEKSSIWMASDEDALDVPKFRSSKLSPADSL